MGDEWLPLWVPEAPRYPPGFDHDSQTPEALMEHWKKWQAWVEELEAMNSQLKKNFTERMAWIEEQLRKLDPENRAAAPVENPAQSPTPHPAQSTG